MCLKHRASGLTLVEVLVALGLISVSLMLVLGMIPAGISSSQRASDVQAAAAWSRELIEETPVPQVFPIPAQQALSNHVQQIGPTIFTAQRRLQVVGPYLYRIEVETSWDAGKQPVKLSLIRYNPGGPLP